MDPKPYFDVNPGVAEQYLIPTQYLEYDQYPEFLAMRRKKIWDRVQEFLGLTDDEMPKEKRVAPGDENRVLDQFEEKMRDFIDARLTTTNDEGYWQEVIPGGVRNAVDRRIKDYLKVHPELSEEEYSSGRSRLNFCDVGDYMPIIEAKRNWPTFDDVFINKAELNRHFISIQRWRNTVKHGREEDIVERMTGEAGILWFQRVLDVQVELPQSEESEENIAAQERPKEEDYYRLLTGKPVPNGQKDLYQALILAGDEGRTRDELVAEMGRRDRKDLGGVFGALGTRVNYTPGYGKKYKPGTSMVLTKKKTPYGEKFFLKPEMVAVLKDLDPDWLRWSES